MARATAAHSTLVIDDRSSARLAPKDAGWGAGLMTDGPRDVAAERSETPEATILSLSHDGYARDFGLIHERKLTLALGRRHALGRRPAASRRGIGESCAGGRVRGPLPPPPARARRVDRRRRSFWSWPMARRFSSPPRAPFRRSRTAYFSPGRAGRANAPRSCCAERPRPARSCAGPSGGRDLSALSRCRTGSTFA